MTRYVIEGEWSGYAGSQHRCVHREVTTREVLADWCRKARDIRFGDGTTLSLSVRLAKKGERISEKRGYTRLIIDCYNADVFSVEELIRAEQNRQVRPNLPAP